jgi:hypothetical protein
MSEETQEKEGTMSTVKKTIIGLVTTAVTAAGVYVTTHIEKLFGVEEEEQTEQVDVQNNNTQQQNQSVIINIPEQQSAPSSTKTIVRETVREVPAQQPAAQPAAAPVEEPKETNAERMARLKAKRAENAGGGN